MIRDENPQVVFDAEDCGILAASDVPLVLIHDGGGTCYAYYCLNPLGRITYEIHNPRFETKEPWTGGIPEMARHYVSLMRARIPGGRILLGGWSLGGILSLEMARLLAEDDMYQVIGIVMVDSICPLGAKVRSELLGKRAVVFDGQFGPHTKQETKECVTWCFSEARRAVATYDPPSWDDDQLRGSEADGAHGSENGGNGRTLGKSTSRKIVCPPVILLRAKESVPTTPGDVSFVDVVREDRPLGWENYRKGMFEEIVEIPGNHFNIFAWEHVDYVSEKMAEACSKLEQISQSRAPALRR